MSDEEELDGLRRAQDEKFKHWHLSKSVQLPVIVLLLSNIFVGIWWAATLSADEHAHYKEMQNKTIDTVKKPELLAQLMARDLGIKHNAKSIDIIRLSQDKMDGKLDRILEKLRDGN